MGFLLIPEQETLNFLEYVLEIFYSLYEITIFYLNTLLTWYVITTLKN